MELLIDYNSQLFIDRWKVVAENNDGCSSGPLKYLVKVFGNRNYACHCVEHDFWYTWGHIYGVSRKQADQWLREGIEASGHSKIAWAVYWGVRVGGSGSYE